MRDDIVAVLGIPVNNLTMDEAIDLVFSMVDDYKIDRRPRQVATVNVDFFVNTLSWSLNAARHPELLNVLRRADMVTADGMPIVWISKLLGTPLKERVTGADMVVELAREGEKRDVSLYFLGGKGEVAELAAEKLRTLCPRLRIAGVDTPFVYTEGKKLLNFTEDDTPIIEKINNSRADILLVAFGNPKQELWFARNRYRLNVPVTIGIGGTFEFIAGRVKRAPEYMQRSGLEWIYRLLQEPGRLWKRYLVGLFKFGFMALPVILMYLLEKGNKNTPAAETVPRVHTISDFPETAHGSFRLVRLPPRLDTTAAETLNNDAARLCDTGATVILDFKDVRFVDLSGLGALIHIWSVAVRNQAYLYMIGVARRLKAFLAVNRMWDMFQDKAFRGAQDLRAEIEKQGRTPSFYYVAEEHRTHLLVSFFGRLDATSYYRLDVDEIKRRWKARNVIIDMSHVTFVDSAGLRFFLQIEHSLAAEGGTCLLCAMNKPVRQVFDVTKLDRVFDIKPDVAAARKALPRGRTARQG